MSSIDKLSSGRNQLAGRRSPVCAYVAAQTQFKVSQDLGWDLPHRSPFGKWGIPSGKTRGSAELAFTGSAKKVDNMLNGNYLKKWRKQRHLSARELGVALGYRGREYIKKLESGYFPITPKFAARFERFKNQTQAREYRERKIETRYPLPPRITILARPRRCEICRAWFIFPNATDRVCTNRKCRRTYRARHDQVTR